MIFSADKSSTLQEYLMKYYPFLILPIRVLSIQCKQHGDAVPPVFFCTLKG